MQVGAYTNTHQSMCSTSALKDIRRQDWLIKQFLKTLWLKFLVLQRNHKENEKIIHTLGENISNNISDEQFVFRICKEHLQLYNKMTNNSKNEQRYKDTLPKNA